MFFDNLPQDYEVYIFYYPGAVPNEDLESQLRNLGSITGRNLFVNIGKLNDPNYSKLVSKFEIRKFPVIIITAIDRLASPPTAFFTTYVKIDSQRILNSPALAIECLQKLFNLFIEGKISEAVSQFRKDQRNALIGNLIDVITNALKGIRDFIVERDISVSLVEGRFELKYRGG